MRHLSLFSGVGGLDIAAHMAGIETVAFVEWEEYPQKILQKRFSQPVFGDIRKVTKQTLTDAGVIDDERTIDIISGGPPCQPFSVAGKQRGAEDDRHLWPEMRRLINELRPRWVVIENVANLVNMVLDDILSDLENEGYTARPFIIPACATGAAHRRDRCFIVGHSGGG